MSDIVERLRERSQNLWTYDKELKDNLLVREAADEIERLRQEKGRLDSQNKELLYDNEQKFAELQRLQRIVEIMQTLTLKDMPQ